MERGVPGTIFILIFRQISKLMAPSSVINILMALASSLMFADSGTFSRIHKLTDFKRLRFHKNVTITSLKNILNCPHSHTTR